MALIAWFWNSWLGNVILVAGYAFVGIFVWALCVAASHQVDEGDQR